MDVHFPKSGFCLLFPVVFFLPRLGFAVVQEGMRRIPVWAVGLGGWAGALLCLAETPGAGAGASLRDVLREKPPPGGAGGSSLPLLHVGIPNPACGAKGSRWAGERGRSGSWHGPGKLQSPGQELPAGVWHPQEFQDLLPGPCSCPGLVFSPKPAPAPHPCWEGAVGLEIINP